MSRKQHLRFATIAIFICTSAAAAFAQDIGPGAGADKWRPWVEFGGFYGSDETSRAEGVLWVPLTQGQTSLLFGEARGKLFEDDMREGNFALGFRQMMPGGWNLGIWGGYDIRESEYGSTFRQLASGIEALSGNWDFRANAYLPLNETETVFSSTSTATTSAIDFSGNQIGLITTVETTSSRLDEIALWGFDGEVGYKLFSIPDDTSALTHELRVYAGAFHFDHADLAESVTGPRLRAEWRMDDVLDGWGGSRLTFEGEYSHDNLRDDRFEVGARLRLPFGGSEGAGLASSRLLTAQERRMTEGLERDTDIVTNASVTSTSTSTTINEGAEDARTGVHFDKVETVDATGDLSAVSATAGANTLIIADGSAGDFGGVLTLQVDQTLMGGGTAIQVRGQTTGNVVDFNASGMKPVFSFTLAEGMTVSGSNTHLSGIALDGNVLANYPLLVAAGTTNVVLADLRIVDGRNSYFPLEVRPGASVIIDRVQIDSNRGIAIRANATAAISNSVIDADYGGINIDNGGVVDLNGTSIDGTLSYSGLGIANATVNGSGNVAGPNFTCLGPGTGWTGSVEFSGTTYTYATNCN